MNVYVPLQIDSKTKAMAIRQLRNQGIEADSISEAQKKYVQYHICWTYGINLNGLTLNDIEVILCLLRLLI